MRNTKGITLIALVITIIVLLILAGVSLSLIMGNEGLLGRATSAVDKNREATAKEQVELLIADFQTEFYGKKYVSANYDETSREYILEKLKDGVSAGGYYVQTDDEAEEGILNVYEGSDGEGELVVSGVLQENGSVEWEEKVKGISVGYRLNPSGYTNGNITLTIKASSSNGSISEIQGPFAKNEDGSYTVTENGDYEFTITDSSGASRTKIVKIQKIDRVAPPEFTPTITDVTEKGFTIEANATDNESGIGKYEYYVGGEKYESTKASYVIDTLEQSTEYSIIVKAYDKAGNSTSSTEIKQTTKEGYVDYEGYINRHMQVDKKIYVSSEHGNDAEGDGTQGKPYATLDKIADVGIVENGYSYAVVLMSGEYELKENMFKLDCNEAINIIGNKKNTVLEVKSLFPNSVGSPTNYSVNLYRLVWHATINDTNNICLKNDLVLYNVAFQFDFESANFAYFCTASTTTTFKFINCTMPKLVSGILRSCSGFEKIPSGYIYLENCYGGFSTSQWGINGDWNYRTNYITNTPKVNPITYQIIEENGTIWKNVGTGKNPDETQANLGVYGGEYSWEK